MPGSGVHHPRGRVRGRTRGRRTALREARAAAAARVADLTRTFDAIVEAASMEALDDEHDPDGATVGFERAQVSALLEAARRDVAALDEALDRFDAGEDDRCERCGAPIPAERLAAVPATRRCVRCAAGARTGEIELSRRSR